MSDPKTIVSQLVKGAKSFAADAGRELAADHKHKFAVAAATAGELLAKAVLCQVHPAAIVDPRQFNSLLRILGHKSAKANTPTKTIGGREALERAITLIPKLKSHEKGLHELIEARNGTVHLGEESGVLFARVVGSFDHLVSETAAGLGLTREDVLGKYAQLFDELRDKAKTEVEQRVSKRVFAAKTRFTERFGDLESGALDSLAPVLESETNEMLEAWSGYEDVGTTSFECPACTRWGVAGCFKEREAKFEKDEDGMGYAWHEVTLLPAYFLCRYCGLQLEDQDEIQAAGIPDKLDGEDESYIDEPDWDYG